MDHTTAFYHDERCLWHTTGEAVLVMPVGGSQGRCVRPASGRWV